LANELEEKSLATDDALVVKAETNVPTEMPFASCYDPNTDSWNQECVNAAMSKYMVDIRNSMNTVKPNVVNDSVVLDAIHSYYVTHRPEKPVVEESMDKIIEAKAEEKEKVDDKKEEEKEKEEKSVPAVNPLDENFEELKSRIASGKSAAEVQDAFNKLGKTVEEVYTPPAPNANDIVEIVRSAVEAAIAPLRVELATLRASGAQQKVIQQNPVSRALTLKPSELIQKSQQKPTRQLTQIEKIARSSTGIPTEQ